MAGEWGTGSDPMPHPSPPEISVFTLPPPLSLEFPIILLEVVMDFYGTTHCMHISYLINEYVWRWSLVFFHQFSSIIILMTEIILWFRIYFHDWVIIVISSLLVAIQSFFLIIKSQNLVVLCILRLEGPLVVIVYQGVLISGKLWIDPIMQTYR